MLACAPSNLAVDNVFERLLGFGERVVRLGHPARVLPELREHTLDLLVEAHHDVRLARKLVKQALGLFREAGKQRRTAPKPVNGGSFATTPGLCWPTLEDGATGRREHSGLGRGPLRHDHRHRQPIARARGDSTWW